MTDEIITRALHLWGCSAAIAELVAQRENRVFRVSNPDRSRMALRLHRRGYRSDDELRSELQWINALAERGFANPVPQKSIRGNYLETVADIQVDMISWLDGTPLGATGTALELDDRHAVFHRIGREMARMHSLSDDWQAPADFTRCRWDADGLLGNNPVWGRFWENPALSGEQGRLLRQARDEARRHLDGLASGLDYGLIHADLVRENVLLNNGNPQFIDFDDSGFGFRLFDVATALFKNRIEADYPQLEKALVDGYRTVRPLDIEHLPMFMVLRAFTYLGWITPRLDEPGGRNRCRHFVADAVHCATILLSGEKEPHEGGGRAVAHGTPAIEDAP